MTRPSAFRYALGSTRLLGGIVLLGIGGTLCGVTSAALLAERRYRTAPQSDATVVQKQVQSATADSSTEYRIGYTLFTDDGEKWRNTERVDPTTWEAVEEGGTVRVQYLPGEAGSLRLARKPKDRPLAAVTVATAALALLGLAMCGRGGRDVWRTLRIHRYGQPTEATVTSVRETNVAVNRRIQWAVDFTYQDHLGRVHQGTSAPMPASMALQWREGDKASARFDPERPTDSVWIGDSPG